MPRQKPMEVSPGIVVMGLGLLTSALALLIVYALNLKDISVMGFYLNYVIPAGALLVGLIAGSGYAIGSRLRQYRISGGFLVSIFLIQILVYFAAQYITYTQVMQDYRGAVSFWEYYRWTVEEMGWEPEQDDEAMKPFGKWGYAIETLAIAGFAGGSLIFLAAMKGAPYCEYCTRYMKKSFTVHIPATAEKRSIKKKDLNAKQAYEAECQQYAARAQTELEHLQILLQTGRRSEVSQHLQALHTQYHRNAKTPVHAVLTYHECQECENYHLKAETQTVQGNNTSSQKLFTYQREA